MAAKARRQFQSKHLKLIATPHSKQILPIVKPKIEVRILGILGDGWMARFRGAGWGKKKTKKDRVEWHEIKTGVFYRHEQVAHTESGRGLISEKVVVR
jgi:hypothetical protein